MCGYTKDLMMAIVVGGAAFIGLTPVLIGQVARSELKQCWKEVLRRILALSVAPGILAVIFAVNWFAKPSPVVVLPIIWLFTAEIVICEAVMLSFWFGLFRDVERSKPTTTAAPATRTTRSKHPRKRAPAR